MSSAGAAAPPTGEAANWAEQTRDGSPASLTERAHDRGPANPIEQAQDGGAANSTEQAHDSGAANSTERAHDRGPHARIRLIEDNCTSCMICARECPVWCIHIDSHTEADPNAPAQLTGRGMRERTINVLDRFAIDWSLCMYCGICVEECPFDALEWRHDATPATATLAQLTHEIEDLG